MSNLRAALLTNRTRKAVPIDAPELAAILGETKAYARIFSGADRQRLIEAQPSGLEEGSVEARRAQFDAQLTLIVTGVSDEAGAPVFTDEDKTTLADLDASLLDLLASAVMDANGMSKKAAAELEKN